MEEDRLVNQKQARTNFREKRLHEVGAAKYYLSKNNNGSN